MRSDETFAENVDWLVGRLLAYLLAQMEQINRNFRDFLLPINSHHH